MIRPANDLWDCFRDGHRVDVGGERTVVLHTTDAGALDLPWGRIVVSDPLLDPWNDPFKTTVEPGAYPVHLALDEEGEVALAMLLFAEGPPKRWQRAKPGRFSVDSGTGCLMDYRVARFLRQKAEAGKYERYARRFEDALLENETERWAHAAIGASGRLFLFQTWGGDGTFPVYFGFGDEQEPVCLVIDMLPRDEE